MPPRRTHTFNPEPVSPEPPEGPTNPSSQPDLPNFSAPASIQLRILPVYDPPLSHNQTGWTFYKHELGPGFTSRRVPVTNYQSPDLATLVNYISNVYQNYLVTIRNVHGESLLFCANCGWTFQNYITETCDHCKARIQWNCAEKGPPPPTLTGPA